jgi:hypothetical protein
MQTRAVASVIYSSEMVRDVLAMRKNKMAKAGINLRCQDLHWG